MLTALLLMVGGIALLAFAGARLVDFAAALAEKARVSPAVVGLTVVAAGTSAPELFVSLSAALAGSPSIALGNVVGSNIANVGLILGTCAALSAIPMTKRLLKFEYPFTVLSSWIVLLLCRDGWVDRLEGGFFLGSMVAFIAYTVWVARRALPAAELRGVEAEVVPAQAERLKQRSAWLLVGGLAASLVGLAVGARLTVAGAVRVAQAVGMSERVVGLTLVAAGTSLPELVASLAAALKRQHEMAVANVLGSNVFNVLMILGLTGLVAPVAVEPGLVSLDLWVMMAMAVVLFPLVFWDRTLSRLDGGLLLLGYSAYVAWLVIQG